MNRARLPARADAGFTLIELMVVVLIIAILMAVAIPTFLGARERAMDRAAHSNLRTALLAAKAEYTGNQFWPPVGADLSAVETSLVWKAVPVVASDASVVVHIANSRNKGADSCLELRNFSRTGRNFAIMDVVLTSGAAGPCGVATPGTWFSSDGGATWQRSW